MRERLARISHITKESGAVKKDEDKTEEFQKDAEKNGRLSEDDEDKMDLTELKMFESGLDDEAQD